MIFETGQRSIFRFKCLYLRNVSQVDMGTQLIGQNEGTLSKWALLIIYNCRLFAILFTSGNDEWAPLWHETALDAVRKRGSAMWIKQTPIPSINE